MIIDGINLLAKISEEARTLVDRIGRLGRQAGIYLILVDQKQDGLARDRDKLLGYRIALHSDPNTIRWALGGEQATAFPRGGGAIRVGQNKPVMFTMDPKP